MSEFQLGPDVPVITAYATPFTLIATAESIAKCGAKPVFPDIDPKTYNIDPQKIDQYLQSRTRSKSQAPDVIAKGAALRQSESLFVSVNLMNSTNSTNSSNSTNPMTIHQSPGDGRAAGRIVEIVTGDRYN